MNPKKQKPKYIVTLDGVKCALVQPTPGVFAKRFIGRKGILQPTSEEPSRFDQKRDAERAIHIAVKLSAFLRSCVPAWQVP